MTSGEKIIAACIRYAKLLWVLVIALFGYGIYALICMNKNEFPNFTIRQGIVVGVYPGANVEQTEKQLTLPLEELLFEFPEINRELTYSITKDGMSYVYVYIDDAFHDQDAVWSKVRHKLNEQKNLRFPAGVLALAVIDDFGSTSTLLIAMESKDKTYREMHEYTTQLSRALTQLPEMGRVKILGEMPEEIAVHIDQAKLAAHGLSPQTLMLNYAAQNLLIINGNQESGVLNQPLHIRTPLNSEKEVEDQIIYVFPDGRSLKVGDIGYVERRYPEATKDVNFNGRNAIVISVEMRPGNNVVFFGNHVNKILQEFQQQLPDSVNLYRITDIPKVVSQSVFSFLRDLLISMLVVIAVMLMLFPIRTALVACTGLPICTAISIGLMNFFNIELNTVTLAALIVVLGMIVDDSIINIDGYIDKLQKGYKPFEAAVSSARELFVPMLVSTMGISMMFFPMTYIITGILGDFVQLFPWTIFFSLSASLVYAMVIIPAMAIRFIQLDTDQRPLNLFERVQFRFFAALQRSYDHLQHFCFQHPTMTITAGVGSIALGILLFFQLNIQMMPTAERDCFSIEVRLPVGSSLQETKAVSDSLQTMLLQDKRIKAVTAFIGEPAPRFHVTYAPDLPASNLAQLIVNTQSNKATEELLPYLHDKYAHYFPKAYVRMRQLDYQACNNPIELQILGEDYRQMRPVVDSIRHFMMHMSDLNWVHSNYDEFLPCVAIQLKSDEAARLGITSATLSVQLRSATNGLPLTNIQEYGRQVPVVLYYGDPSDLENLMIPTSRPKQWVPLRQVAELIPDWQPSSLEHRVGKSCITVRADMKFWAPPTVSMAQIKHYINDELTLPEGVEIKYGGLDLLNSLVIPQIGMSFIAAVLVLFFFLVLYFKKMSISLLTMCASSLCLFGAFFGEWMFGLDFGMTSVLGVVSLIGIIVRNGILMYEYAETLREKGMSAKEAAMEAGSRRMRPIFLTSATTALGVLPMIITHNPLWFPMGVVICFGVILSLIIVLSVMPVTYWQIYKNSRRPEAAPTIAS